MTNQIYDENNVISEENEILHSDLMYTLDKIRFWITIIGIYVLGKMILSAIILTTKISSIIKFLQILENFID